MVPAAVLCLACTGTRSVEQERVERAAAELDQAANRTLKRTTVHFEIADATKFGHLDVPWYEAAAAQLERRGFRRLKDIVPVEHNRETPAAALFIRVLVSADGNTMAGLYHYWDRRHALQYLPNNDVRVVDLESEFLDGHFVVTSNMPREAEFDLGPMIHRRILRANDATRLWDAHQNHLSGYRETHRNASIRTVMTLEDVVAAQQRLKRLEGTYRQEKGIPVTEDELNNATDNRFTEAARAVSEVLRSWFPESR